MAKENQLHQSLGFLSNRINNLLRKRLAAKLEERKIDLSVEGYQLLQCLWEQDGPSQNVLAQLLGYDRPRMSRLIDELEQAQWVRRAPHGENNREKLVVLSRKARDKKALIHKITDELTDTAFKGLNAARRKETIQSLTAILGNLDQ